MPLALMTLSSAQRCCEKRRVMAAPSASAKAELEWPAMAAPPPKAAIERMKRRPLRWCMDVFAPGYLASGGTLTARSFCEQHKTPMIATRSIRPLRHRGLLHGLHAGPGRRPALSTSLFRGSDQKRLRWHDRGQRLATG